MKIIASINNFDFINNRINELNRINQKAISYFRLNLSKENELATLSHIFDKMTNCEKEIFQDKLMIDLPFPRHKSRLFFSPNEKTFNANQKYIFSKDYNNYSDCLITDLNEKICFHKGDSLVLGDGEGEFIFQRYISKNIFEVQANFGFSSFSGKAIHNSNSVTFNRNPIGAYASIIDVLNPKIVALSFVENASDINILKKK